MIPQDRLRVGQTLFIDGALDPRPGGLISRAEDEDPRVYEVTKIEADGTVFVRQVLLHCWGPEARLADVPGEPRLE